MTGAEAAADWTRQGVTFDGGSRDGGTAEIYPSRMEFINLENTLESEEFVELYERTAEARAGRTVYRFVRRRRDLED